MSLYLIQVNTMLAKLPEAEFGQMIEFREYSFLENPSLPKKVLHHSRTVSHFFWRFYCFLMKIGKIYPLQKKRSQLFHIWHGKYCILFIILKVKESWLSVEPCEETSASCNSNKVDVIKFPKNSSEDKVFAIFVFTIS